MFPETFVEKHLVASRFDGVVFDPFCGRGTTLFQALLEDRDAAGCDTNPVAACVSAAKCDHPTESELRARLDELEATRIELVDDDWSGELGEFFDLCFYPDTLTVLRFLRAALDWRGRRDDGFLAALCLGQLHGESHKSENVFSNRMPRTISTKPAYSVRWWRREGCEPPPRDVFAILHRMISYRFRTPPPERRGRVSLTDARGAAAAFDDLTGRVTDVITSPPYLDTTNYREDQWLRLWFLGGPATARYSGDDDRHYTKLAYWKFLTEAWRGLRPLLSEESRFVVRVGGRRLEKDETRKALTLSLETALERKIRILDDGVTSSRDRTQANIFRGSRVSPTVEHDFCFAASH